MLVRAYLSDLRARKPGEDVNRQSRQGEQGQRQQEAVQGTQGVAEDRVASLRGRKGENGGRVDTYQGKNCADDKLRAKLPSNPLMHP